MRITFIVPIIPVYTVLNLYTIISFPLRKTSQTLLKSHYYTRIILYDGESSVYIKSVIFSFFLSKLFNYVRKHLLSICSKTCVCVCCFHCVRKLII